MGKSYWEIAKINLRHNLCPYIFLAALAVVLTAVFFGTTALSEQAAAVPLEMMFPAAGVILLTSVFRPEENMEIREAVRTRYISLWRVEVLRVLCMLLVLMILTGAFGLYMKGKGSEVTFRLIFGAFADGVFLGGMGFLAAALCGHTAVAYLFPMLYYVWNYSGREYLGRLYLFSMMQGDFSGNIWLFGGGVFFLAAGLVVRRKVSS